MSQKDESIRSVTEKGAPTFTTSSDPRVDYFFHVSEDVSKDRTIELLTASWSCDALDTLKLMAYLRDCRHGKGIRKQFQWSMFWLYQNHRRTLMKNLHLLASEYGYFKDVLQFMIIVLFNGDLDVENSVKSQTNEQRSNTEIKRRKSKSLSETDKIMYKQMYALMKQTGDKCEDLDDDSGHKKQISGLQKSRNRFSTLRLKYDADYRELYEHIVCLFGQKLVEDLKKMHDNKPVSLIGKWAPSPLRHHDKYSAIATPIALYICKTLETEITEQNAALIYYQTKVLAPLRKYLKIPEVYMSAKLWADLDYKRVAAKCMQKCRKLFTKYDSERFAEFVASRKKIAGATLTPVELVERALNVKHNEPIERNLLEKQWISLCEDIEKKGGGLLGSSIAVCDVSGSMSGIPMHAAIGLTILTMRMTAPPWNTNCITFHERPSMFNVDPNASFYSKVHALQSMPWGGTTNFQAVFKLILDTANRHHLTDAQMPKILFVFTDMEFDSAFSGSAKTNYEVAKRQFDAAGYSLPPIVFWNLRGDTDSKSTPVQMNERGTFLLSGYSGQQLSLLLKHNDFTKFTPLSFVREVLDSDRYNQLMVYD